MVPTTVTGLVVSLALLPRVLRTIGPRFTLVAGLVVLAAGHLWLGHAPDDARYMVAVLPGLFLAAVGVALSFTLTTMVIASATPDDHSGLASGLAGAATQVGAALGTAAFTAVALSGGRWQLPGRLRRSRGRRGVLRRRSYSAIAGTTGSTRGKKRSDSSPPRTIVCLTIRGRHSCRRPSVRGPPSDAARALLGKG